MYHTKIFPNKEFSEKLFFPRMREWEGLSYCRFHWGNIIEKTNLSRGVNPHIVFDDRLSRCSVQYFFPFFSRQLCYNFFFFTADFTNDFWYRVQFFSVCCCCCGSLEGLVGSFLYILLFGGLHLSSVIRSEMIFSTRLLGWDGAVLMYTFELFNRIEGCYGIPVWVFVYSLHLSAIDVCTRGKLSLYTGPFPLSSFAWCSLRLMLYYPRGSISVCWSVKKRSSSCVWRFWS